MREVAETAPAGGRSTRNKKAITASDAQQAATKDERTAPSQRPRGRPMVKQKPVTIKRDALSSRRPRGRPPVKEERAEETSSQKRTTAVKGKLVEKPPKQKKNTAVKGNARVTKSSQTERRLSIPRSTHKNAYETRRSCGAPTTPVDSLTSKPWLHFLVDCLISSISGQTLRFTSSSLCSLAGGREGSYVRGNLTSAM